MQSIKECINKLTPDLWRKTVGFSKDITDCSNVVFDASKTRTEKIEQLRVWLTTGQPCVFGKIAAGRALTHICLLEEADLLGPDEDIKGKIQTERTEWKRAALNGGQSAFVIVAAARGIYEAQPDENLKELALRLLSLYLIEDRIQEDFIHRDKVFLYDFPGNNKGKGGRRFYVGTNFFGAQGDKRWWNDHRFPAGIAFSMNSPGHMALASQQRVLFKDSYKRALEEGTKGGSPKRIKQLMLDLEELKTNSVDSLAQILRLAMLTISGSSEQTDSNAGPVWDRATLLLRREQGGTCPFPEIEKDGKLKTFDCNTYMAWYNTDYTVPTDYFRSQDSKRPLDIRPFAMDFSYIHTPGTQAFSEMGEGILDDETL